MSGPDITEAMLGAWWDEFFHLSKESHMIDFKVTDVQGVHLKDVTFEVGMQRKSVTIEGCPGEWVEGETFELTPAAPAPAPAVEELPEPAATGPAPE
jgi:hypothetical protein